MNNRIQSRPFISISKLLIVRILAFSSFVTLILTFIQLNREYKTRVEKVNENLEQVSKILIPEMVNNIWNLDESAVKVQLQSIISLNSFHFTEIEFDKQTYSYGNSKTSDFNKSEKFALYKEVNGNRYHLGMLTIVTDFQPIFSSILDQGLIILLQNALKTFVVVFFMIYLFNRDIFVHLNKISNSLKDFKIKDMSKNLVIERKKRRSEDELDVVVRSINLMQKNIRDEFIKLEISQREKDELQVKLGQSQKMEALGRLAGGIAHDFNNILQIILGETERLIENSKDTDKSNKEDLTSMQKILDSSLRGDKLIKQILTYTYQRKTEVSNIELTALLYETLDMMRATLPANIQIFYDSKDPIYTKGDRIQYQQVIMNLCTNSKDAIGDRRGEIHVSLNSDLNTNMITLSFSDNGDGIDKSIQSKIFEPYFSTKPINKGTGMGLSIIQAIIHNFNGEIKIDSSKTSGATFSITLPLLTDVQECNNDVQKTEISGHDLKGKKVLILDDEESILFLHHDLINKKNGKAFAFTKPLEALEKLKHGLEVDAIVVDLSMPSMTGIEFAECYRNLNGKAPIFLLTGYETTAVTKEQMKELNVVKVLHKPIRRAEFLEELAAI